MKKNIKYMIYGVVVLIGAVVGIMLVRSGTVTDSQGDIVEVFASIGAQEPTGIVEAQGTYIEGYLELYKREELLIALGEELGIMQGYEITSTYENGRAETKYFKQTNQVSTTLYFVTLEDEEEDNVITTKQYLLVKICIENNVYIAEKYYNVADGLMERYCMDSSTTVNLEGSYKGKLSLEERNQIAADLLEKLHAEIVTGNRDMELYTLYGYTDWIEGYKLVDDKKINVNIAISYDDMSDETLVYVATPIVGIDY